MVDGSGALGVVLPPDDGWSGAGVPGVGQVGVLGTTGGVTTGGQEHEQGGAVPLE